MALLKKKLQFLKKNLCKWSNSYVEKKNASKKEFLSSLVDIDGRLDHGELWDSYIIDRASKMKA